MIYIAMNIILSSFFILCIKWVQGRKEDTISVGEVNYIVAGICGCVLLTTANGAASTTAVTLGTINGICYFTAFFFLLPAVKAYGAAATAVVTRLSIILPIIIGVSFLSERPTLLQAIGILLACAALLLMGQRPAQGEPGKTRSFNAFFALSVFFLIAGGSRVAQGIFRHQCESHEKPYFLVSAFAFAGVASIVLLVYRRKRITLSELGIGTLLGLSNIGQTWLILKSLEYFDGFVVFPITSAGGLVFTTFCAVGGFKETINARTVFGISFAVLALMLLY